MNLCSDIIRYAIPHNCRQCIHYGDCSFACYKSPNPHCLHFVPDNMNAFLNEIVTYFRLNVPKSKETKLKRVCRYNGAYNDKVTTLDEYYVNFINDCIGELHKDKTVYIFKLGQLWEIMKFYSNVVAISVGDGIIALSSDKK